MNDSLSLILKKLDEIDSRLRNLETPSKNDSLTKNRDPLFSKALEVIDKYDEISSKMLSDALKIDIKRAETIMDQMEAAGIGTCYTKEV